LTDLVDRSTGDVISSSDQNLMVDYIEDGTHKVNTLSLDIGGNEIIDANRYIKPVRILNPDASGTLFYDSAGTTHIATLDESGNLLLKGRVLSL